MQYISCCVQKTDTLVGRQNNWIIYVTQVIVVSLRNVLVEVGYQRNVVIHVIVGPLPLGTCNLQRDVRL